MISRGVSAVEALVVDGKKPQQNGGAGTAKQRKRARALCGGPAFLRSFRLAGHRL